MLINLRDTVKIDRTTVFGNPFKIGKDCSRDESIEKYRTYFYERIRADINFKMRVESLKGKKVFACWCAPERCHGEVIEEYLNNLEKDGKKHE